MPSFRAPELHIERPDWRGVGMTLVGTALLVGTSAIQYIWFHTLAELFTVVMGVTLFLMARATFPLTNNAYLLCVAIGFFWSSLLDVFHLLTFKGMVVYTQFRADVPTLLWLSARTCQVGAFLLAPYYLYRTEVDRWVFPLFGAVAVLLFGAVLSDWMPVAYNTNEGMTAFKILWEWALILGILWSAIRLGANRERLAPGLYQVVLWILLLMAATELSFTLYETPSSFANLIGHVFKIWTYSLVFWLVSRHMLIQPKRLMKHQARLLQDVLSRVPGMAFQLQRCRDGSLHFTLVSTGCSEIFELTPEEVLDSPTRPLSRIDERARRTLFSLLEQSSKTLTPWRCEWEATLPRQGKRWHRVETTAPELRDDGAYYWIGHIHDLTEQKALKEDLVEHRDHLARLVSEQTRELRVAMMQVEEAARARNEFLSRMSHEIRTPLNGIIGMAQIGIRSDLPKQGKVYLEQIQDSGELLLSLVNDILDVAKIEAGKLRIEHLPINLHWVIERAVRLTAHRAHAKQLKLEVETAPNLPQGIMGDEVRLVQVLVNLLGNAIKFTDQGHVRLKVSNSAGPDGKDWLLISVEDTGVGMSAECIGRLFGAFEQAESSTTRRFGGSGLGLTITKQIVDLLHGVIDVASQEGHGSCFMVRIPYVEAVAPPGPSLEERPQEERQRQRLDGVRILAAEDEPVNQWVLRELLGQEGATVEVFDNGADLVAAVQRGAPADVVLTDIQMPEMNGYETTRHLSAIRPNLAVIGLTAYALPEERARCLDVGMRDHVTKPIEIETLVSAIQRVLAGGAASAKLDEPVTSSERVLETSGAGEAPPIGLNWEGLYQRLKTPRLIETMLKSFIQHHQNTPQQLGALLETGDLQAVAMLAHKIRGVAGLLVANETKELADRLESHIETKREIDLLLGTSLQHAVTDLLEAAHEGLKYLAAKNPQA